MNNYFWDTHAHIYQEYYDNIPEIINNANKNNIKYIINAGCDQISNEEVLKVSFLNENVYVALGIHPENVDKYQEENLSFIENNISNKKVLAIGEIGLDYHYSKENKENQILLLEKQLKLAEKNHLPVIIHSRETTEDTIKTLKKFNVKGIIHSFSGSLETANIYLKMGFLLGINGVVTFKNSNLKNILKEIPVNKIVLETDSPYLSPEPKRGTKNEPSNIYYISRFVANIYNISIDELSEITNKNVNNLFKIL